MKIQKVRFEHFGGIIGTEHPTSLMWVDREYLRVRGFDGEAVWQGDDPGRLSAPVEMEIAITSRCNLNCPCCYMDAGDGGQDAPEEAVIGALEVASGMGVFHVAFGGGEPLLHPRLLFLAREARVRNLIPTLTTNGTLVTNRWARKAHRLFARVNVSLDLEDGPRDSQCPPQVAWKAIEVLRNAGIVCGVNFIVTSHNIHRLPQLFEAAAGAGVDSVLLLRPKPSGRGKTAYDSLNPTPQQQRALLPELMSLSEEHRLSFHLDCAFAPLLISSPRASDKALQLLGAFGCIAGHLLVTVDVEGIVHPCSHLDICAGPVEKLPALWKDGGVWQGLQTRHLSMQGKCVTCPRCELCRGGCVVVNQYRGQSLMEPDPDIVCQFGNEYAVDL